MTWRRACRKARRALADWCKVESAGLTTLQYDAHAMIQFGGKSWPDFNASFLPEMLKSQEKDGSFRKIEDKPEALRR